MKTIGIIFAMDEEINELKKYINITHENKIFDLVFYEVLMTKKMYSCKKWSWKSKCCKNYSDVNR